MYLFHSGVYYYVDTCERCLLNNSSDIASSFDPYQFYLCNVCEDHKIMRWQGDLIARRSNLKNRTIKIPSKFDNNFEDICLICFAMIKVDDVEIKMKHVRVGKNDWIPPKLWFLDIEIQVCGICFAIFSADLRSKTEMAELFFKVIDYLPKRFGYTQKQKDSLAKLCMMGEISRLRPKVEKL